MIKKLSLKNIMFAVIAIAMFVCGISTLASFSNIKPANVNVEKQIETKVSAEGNEARIGETEYATLEEAFAAANEMSDYDITIYCIASDIVVDSTINVYKSITLLCEGTNVMITRNMDDEMFLLGEGNIYGEIQFGLSVDDEYKITLNGNKKAYSMISGKGKLVVNCGTFLGDLNKQATVGPENGGFYYGDFTETITFTIYGGEFRNFYATNGGVIWYNSNDLIASNIYGGIFENNKAEFGGVMFGTNLAIHISAGTFQNNTATIGGTIFNMTATLYISGGTFDNNFATGDENIEAGIGNDIYNFAGKINIFNGAVNDISTSSLAMASMYSEINCYGGNIDSIKFANPTISMNGQSLPVDAQGNINIYNDFNLNGSIKLDGADGQVVNVTTVSDEMKTSIKESFGVDVTSVNALANTYKIDGSAENFASYYQDTGKAIVTYADGIEVDKNDFTCTNGSIITSAQVEGGSVTSLYLTAPTESTPSTGFVDEQLLPALAIGLLSIVLVAFVARKKKFSNK